MLSVFLFYNIGVFIFGLIVGSFLNCVIYRLEKGESFLKGRSYCPHCNRTLNWRDLFPVFSFLCLGGKCRYCRQKISWQYPAIEISSALIFLLISNFQFPISNKFSIFEFANLLFSLYIASSLIVIFIYDLRHYIIPDKVLFPAIAMALLHRFYGDLPFILNYLLAAMTASGFFLIIFFISKGKWIGFGDVKLAILLGLILGMPGILAGLFLAFFFGAIVGLLLMIAKKKGLKSEVPFAPFLILGAFLAMFFGDAMVAWYFNLLFGA